MKKKYFIIFAISLLGLSTIAQTIITHSGNAPQMGDIYHRAGANVTIEPGPSGVGQTWDFSNITPTLFLTGTVVTPSSTPFSNDFPESNIAFHYVGENQFEQYSFAELNNMDMQNDGTGMEPGTTNEFFIHFTDAVKIMQYPFAYNDSYTDSYFTSYSIYGEMITHERGNITVSADAWGSISTPYTTYPNTLRIKSERNYTDSVWMNGMFLYANVYSQTDYDWFTANSHIPVMSISVREDGTSAMYITDATGIEKEKALNSSIDLYPNPAINRINIKLSHEYIIDPTITIYDLSGKQLKHLKKASNNHFSTNISSFVSGEYIIRIEDKSKKTVTKRFIKK